MAGLPGGVEEGLVARMGGALKGDMDGPVAAAVLVGAAFPCLQAAEVREDRCVVPPGAAALGPAVVVGGVAPDEHRGVDRPAATEDPPRRPRLDGAAPGRIGFGAVAPVAGSVHEGEGGGNEHVAGLEHEHVGAAGGQPAGDDTSRRPPADDDVVEGLARRDLRHRVVSPVTGSTGRGCLRAGGGRRGRRPWLRGRASRGGGWGGSGR